MAGSRPPVSLVSTEELQERKVGTAYVASPNGSLPPIWKAPVGRNWHKVAEATGGLGGADLDEPRCLVASGPAELRKQQEFLGRGSPRAGSLEHWGSPSN